MTLFTTYETDSRHIVRRRTFDFREGDVLSYTPDGDRHCIEGTAIVWQGSGKSLVAEDTFWGGAQRNTDSMIGHMLSATELESAHTDFNLNDVEPFDGRKADFQRYAPKDRFVIHSQHGHSVARFLSRGASEDNLTIVRDFLDQAMEARSKAESAVRYADFRAQELALVVTSRTPTTQMGDIVGCCEIDADGFCDTHGYHTDGDSKSCSEFDRQIEFLSGIDLT